MKESGEGETPEIRVSYKRFTHGSLFQSVTVKIVILRGECRSLDRQADGLASTMLDQLILYRQEIADYNRDSRLI